MNGCESIRMSKNIGHVGMTPTACMNAARLIGSIRSTLGLRYICQLVSRLKNLSRPARNGPSPNPSLNAHHAELSVLSSDFKILLSPG